MSVLAKQNAFLLLNLSSIDELNSDLSKLASSLLRQGKDVPSEIANPEAHENISKEHLTLLRDYKRGALEELKQLAGAQNGNSNGQSRDRVEEESSLTVTDDDILDVAASTGVDLDVVMNAAAHVADLEALVKWVEVYKELEDEQRIKDSAKQQFELDQLRKKESQLGNRLTAALNKTPVNTSFIRERLGVAVPKTVTKLGNWDGKVDSENAPDFLKTARAKVAQAGIGQN